MSPRPSRSRQGYLVGQSSALAHDRRVLRVIEPCYSRQEHELGAVDQHPDDVLHPFRGTPATGGPWGDRRRGRPSRSPSGSGSPRGSGGSTTRPAAPPAAPRPGRRLRPGHHPVSIRIAQVSDQPLRLRVRRRAGEDAEVDRVDQSLGGLVLQAHRGDGAVVGQAGHAVGHDAIGQERGLQRRRASSRMVIGSCRAGRPAEGLQHVDQRLRHRQRQGGEVALVGVERTCAGGGRRRTPQVS